MRRVSKKQRKALRCLWRQGKPRSRKDHVRRITMAMDKADRRR